MPRAASVTRVTASLRRTMEKTIQHSARFTRGECLEASTFGSYRMTRGPGRLALQSPTREDLRLYFAPVVIDFADRLLSNDIDRYLPLPRCLLVHGQHRVDRGTSG